MTVAALFVRADSVYKALPGVDAWDRERDARRWPGGASVVAHPPCGQWGRLSTFARVDPDGKSLALLALKLVRTWGGVLEHPCGSRLWREVGSTAYTRDEFGGWTITVSQKWWGHRAEKLTTLYIVGCQVKDIPPIPYTMGEAERVCGRSRRRGHRPEITKIEREATPRPFAEWLVEVARRAA